MGECLRNPHGSLQAGTQAVAAVGVARRGTLPEASGSCSRRLPAQAPKAFFCLGGQYRTRGGTSGYFRVLWPSSRPLRVHVASWTAVAPVGHAAATATGTAVARSVAACLGGILLAHQDNSCAEESLRRLQFLLSKTVAARGSLTACCYAPRALDPGLCFLLLLRSAVPGHAHPCASRTFSAV